MPDLKPIFIPQITDDNSQWEKDFAKAFQSLSDDLRGILGTVGYFVDRGDPTANYDFIETDLTIDSAWHDMNLSSIVPSGAKAVCLMVRMVDNLPEKAILLRKNGSAGVINYSILFTQVANISVAQDMIVPCDSNRFIEYYVDTGVNTIFIAVKGWWL